VYIPFVFCSFSRFNLDKETGRKVITSRNYLPKKQEVKIANGIEIFKKGDGN